MTVVLRLSFNELRSLFQRVADAKWLRTYDTNAVADLLTWLEIHGFGGIAMAQTIMADNRVASKSEENTAPECIAALTIFDHVIGNAGAGRQTSFEISGLSNPGLILHGLTRCGSAGLASLSWADADPNIRAAIRPGAAFPEHNFEIDSQAYQLGVLNLYCTRDIQAFNHHPQVMRLEANDPGYETCEASDEFSRQQNDAFACGIAVLQADYDQMSNFANQILVPTSERSRVGAGD